MANAATHVKTCRQAGRHAGGGGRASGSILRSRGQLLGWHATLLISFGTASCLACVGLASRDAAKAPVEVAAL
eukprot:scaffold207_cov409-Prasinococcus_capsulatus_cf.AAC.16